MDPEPYVSWWTQYFSSSWGWVIQVFIVIFFTLLLSYIQTRVYKKLAPKLKKTAHVWDDALLMALYHPLKVCIWFLGFLLALFVVSLNMGDGKSYYGTVKALQETGIVLLLVWFFVRFIKEIEKNLIKPKVGRRRVDETSMRAITQLLRLSVILTAALILMQTFGLPISGVIAFGGAGGVAIGFAAKDLLANFFGALMIFFDRPFAIGDWIRSPDKEIEGTVERISWRATRIRTFDRRPLYVPNSMFLNISLENPSRMQNRRIKTHVGLRYEDSRKTADILKQIEHMLQNHPEIDTTRTLFVHLIDFGPSSLVFEIYTFTKTTNWVQFQAIQQDVFLKVLEIIHKNDADIAYPTTTLHVPNPLKIKGSQ